MEKKSYGKITLNDVNDSQTYISCKGLRIHFSILALQFVGWGINVDMCFLDRNTILLDAKCNMKLKTLKLSRSLDHSFTHQTIQIDSFCMRIVLV